MLLFKFTATPKRRTGWRKKMAGAHVYCWIDFKAAWGAEVIAKARIRKHGWIPWRVMDVRLVTLRETPPALKKYHREARRFGYSYLYDWWRDDRKRRRIKASRV